MQTSFVGLNKNISVTETSEALMRRYTFTCEHHIASVRYSDIYQEYSIDVSGFYYQTKDKAAMIALLNKMMR